MLSLTICSNQTRLLYQQPSDDFLPNLVISFSLQHYIPALTPVTAPESVAPVNKRSTRAAQCPAGQYLALDLGDLRCATCPVGSYCPGDDIRYLCSNAPRNVSEYTAPGAVSAACPFSCRAGWYRAGDSCLTVPPGYTVSPLNSSQLLLCDTILPQVPPFDTCHALTRTAGTPTTNSCRRTATIGKPNLAPCCCPKAAIRGSSGWHS